MGKRGTTSCPITTKESHIYPRPDFLFIPGIFFHRYKWWHVYRLEPPTGTNVLSQRLVGPWFNPPDTNASHLYQLVALPDTNVRPTHLYRAKTPPGTNVGTFVPGRVLARYKCATGIIPSSSPCPEPLLTLLLPLSNSSSPSPMAPYEAFVRFAMISLRFHSLKWYRG
jgi:hypothetical protein